MLISEVSAQSGLEPKTIRFYERAKLLSPKRHGRIRIYRTAELVRLRIIKQLRSFDLPIAKIRDLLRNEEPLILDETMSSFTRDVLAKHLEELATRQIEIQNQIRDLSAKLNSSAAAALTPDETKKQNSGAVHEKTLAENLAS